MKEEVPHPLVLCDLERFYGHLATALFVNIRSDDNQSFVTCAESRRIEYPVGFWLLQQKVISVNSGHLMRLLNASIRFAVPDRMLTSH